MAFFSNLTNIRMLSFPHRNTIRFMGMKPKKEYLAWRAKNGFFTALDKKGVLFTWSKVTGDILYSENLTLILDTDSSELIELKAEITRICRDFEVFKGDEDDVSWCSGYHNHEEYSI